MRDPDREVERRERRMEGGKWPSLEVERRERRTEGGKWPSYVTIVSSIGYVVLSGKTQVERHETHLFTYGRSA